MTIYLKQGGYVGGLWMAARPKMPVVPLGPGTAPPHVQGLSLLGGSLEPPRSQSPSSRRTDTDDPVVGSSIPSGTFERRGTCVFFFTGHRMMHYEVPMLSFDDIK